MSKMIKILHVDPDFKVTYFIYGPGSSIRTLVPLQTAIDLLEKVDFDLILSEPHNKAILTKENSVNGIKRVNLENLPGHQSYDQPFKDRGASHGYLGEVRPNRYS
jgi:hypothetical protein